MEYLYSLWRTTFACVHGRYSISYLAAVNKHTLKKVLVQWPFQILLKVWLVRTACKALWKHVNEQSATIFWYLKDWRRILLVMCDTNRYIAISWYSVSITIMICIYTYQYFDCVITEIGRSDFVLCNSVDGLFTQLINL